MSGEQKLKEGDSIVRAVETTNNRDLLFFTDRCQVYKARLADFDCTKASVMGEYIPSKLGMDEGERPIAMAITRDYEGSMLFCFDNGKIAKVQMSAYATKTNRRKLLAAYSDKAPLVAAIYAPEDSEYLLTSSSGKMLLLHSGALQSKTTKNTQGVAVMTLRRNHRVIRFEPYKEGSLQKPFRYRAKSLPAAGAMPAAEETLGEQLELE